MMDQAAESQIAMIIISLQNAALINCIIIHKVFIVIMDKIKGVAKLLNSTRSLSLILFLQQFWVQQEEMVELHYWIIFYILFKETSGNALGAQY